MIYSYVDCQLQCRHDSIYFGFQINMCLVNATCITCIQQFPPLLYETYISIVYASVLIHRANQISLNKVIYIYDDVE